MTKISTRRQFVRGNRRSVAPAPPPEQTFGNTWTLVERVQYYGSAEISQMEAVPGADDAIIGNGTTTGSDEGVKRITSGGGGTELWSFQPGSNAAFEGSGKRSAFAFFDDYVMVGGEFASTVERVWKLDLATGSEEWFVGTSTPVHLDVDDAGLCFQFDFDVEVHDTTAASAPSVTTYSSSSSNSRSLRINAANTHLFVLDQQEDLNIWDLSGRPGSGTWNPDTVVDMTADVSTPWGSVSADTGVYACPVDAGAVWVHSGTNEWIYKIDSDGSELVAINPEDDLTNSGFTVRCATVDIEGNFYCILQRVGEVQILKYDSDGTLLTSTEAQSITVEPSEVPLCMCVTEVSGTIYVGTGGGWSIEYGVS